MNCRPLCGACCIAPSINTPMPGMPQGKKAGERCLHLDDQFQCRLFGSPERPAFCASLKHSAEMCGNSRAEAMHFLSWLEQVTE